MQTVFSRRKLLAAGVGAAALGALPTVALSQLRIEITGVGANQIPVALMPMAGSAASGIDLMQIVAADFGRTGEFRLIQGEAEASAEDWAKPNVAPWAARGASVLATGAIDRKSQDEWEIVYKLFDAAGGTLLDESHFLSTDVQLRMTAHRIADRIYDKLTGLGGLFTSRIAYVNERAQNQFELVIADSDGANARTALRSSEPIISPAWSPDGKQVAYVSFENKKPVVYVHTLATGKRRVVANFRGNNSAPAFSPDGAKLAVALSRDGMTQIFLINADGTGVKRFSRSLAIDTEPCFSVDGKYIYFTSDRGGSPQIYRQMVGSDQAERVTFDSGYAVSPSIDAKGTNLAYVSRDSGRYRVSVMDLQSGEHMLVSRTDFDESPSFSPNGRMIIYATERDKRGVLATASVDGTVHAMLSGPAGDIREPTWGPLITNW
ncbi:MAG TPA: Tol-Pal system protein TolB [Sutterella sp.]|nr:Tol-Pal system protein TolB [Sutterella sp.]